MDIDPCLVQHRRHVELLDRGDAGEIGAIGELGADAQRLQDGGQLELQPRGETRKEHPGVTRRERPRGRIERCLDVGETVDGLNITFVDTASAISAYLDLIDTIHLNIGGHEKFKNAFVNVMNGGSSAEMIVPQFVVWSGSVDFPSLAANSCDEMAIALKGAGEGDPVLASIPVALADSSKQTAFFTYVSSPGVVTMRRCNVTATAAPNPPSVIVRVIALKY